MGLASLVVPQTWASLLSYPSGVRTVHANIPEGCLTGLSHPQGKVQILCGGGRLRGWERKPDCSATQADCPVPSCMLHLLVSHAPNELDRVGMLFTTIAQHTCGLVSAPSQPQTTLLSELLSFLPVVPSRRFGSLSVSHAPP